MTTEIKTIKRNGQTFEVPSRKANYIRQVDGDKTVRFIETWSTYGERLYAQAFS